MKFEMKEEVSRVVISDVIFDGETMQYIAMRYKSRRTVHLILRY